MYATGVSKASPAMPAQTAPDGSVGRRLSRDDAARRTARELIVDAARGHASVVANPAGFRAGCASADQPVAVAHMRREAAAGSKK